MFIYKQVKEIIINNIEALHPFSQNGEAMDLKIFFRKQAFIGLQNLIDGNGLTQKELLHSVVSYGILAAFSNANFLTDCDLIISSDTGGDLVFNEESAGFLPFDDAVIIVTANLQELVDAENNVDTKPLAFLSICAKLESTIAHQLLGGDSSDTIDPEFATEEDLDFLDAMIKDEVESNSFVFTLAQHRDGEKFDTLPMEKYKEVNDYDFYRSQNGILITKTQLEGKTLGFFISDVDSVDLDLENFIDEDTFSSQCPIIFDLIVIT